MSRFRTEIPISYFNHTFETFRPDTIIVLEGYHQPFEPPCGFDPTGKPMYPGCEEEFDVERVSFYVPNTSIEADLTQFFNPAGLEALTQDVVDYVQKLREESQ